MLAPWVTLIALVLEARSLATRPPPATTKDVSFGIPEAVAVITSAGSATSTTPATPITPTMILDSASFTTSTWVTMTTSSRDHIELRANANCRCFDDRGFPVDCATWTGYYYTWGPANDPCLGGPGQGGGNGGGGSDYRYVYSAASSIRVRWQRLMIAMSISAAVILS